MDPRARRRPVITLVLAVLVAALLSVAVSEPAEATRPAPSAVDPWPLPLAATPDARRGATFPTTDWFLPPGRPRAVVITIHGGGWFQSTGYTEGTERLATMFTRAGAAAVNIDYESGAESLPDVIEAYDAARARYPRLPICAYGWSAGGNLALLLANQRDLACVIAEAAPTDIYTGTQEIKDLADFFFPDDWTGFSPALTTTTLTQPTVLVSATNDELVPHSQTHEFKVAFPATTVFRLPPGAKHFVHSDVSAPRLKAARHHEIELVRRVGRR